MKKDERKFDNDGAKPIDFIKNYSYSIQYLSFIAGTIMSIVGLVIIVFLLSLIHI